MDISTLVYCKIPSCFSAEGNSHSSQLQGQPTYPRGFPISPHGQPTCLWRHAGSASALPGGRARRHPDNPHLPAICPRGIGVSGSPNICYFTVTESLDSDFDRLAVVGGVGFARHSGESAGNQVITGLLSARDPELDAPRSLLTRAE